MNAENQNTASVLWVDDSDDDDRPLRRPNAASTTASHITNEMNNLTLDSRRSGNEVVELNTQLTSSGARTNASIVSRSTLSVNAREWYPRNFVSQVQAQNISSSSIQNRLSRIKGECTEQQQQQHHHSQLNHEADNNNDVVITITRLKEIINAIIYDPGKFELLLDTILDMVQLYYEDVNTVDKLADTIFEQATTKVNFRYNGARLCNVLQGQCALFGSRLYVLCARGVRHDRGDGNILGVTYFLAELYTQLYCQSMYGVCLLDAMKCLLEKHRDADAFKCVCQSLKLSGFYLDIDHRSSVDEIFQLLESELATVPENLKNVFKSVSDLRANNWGHGSQQQQQQTTAIGSTNGYQDQNGYISNNHEQDLHGGSASDGLAHEISTDDEHELFANYEEYNEYINDDFDPDDLYDPEPEMDEEIRTAFKDFVQFSKQ